MMLFVEMFFNVAALVACLATMFSLWRHRTQSNLSSDSRLYLTAAVMLGLVALNSALSVLLGRSSLGSIEATQSIVVVFICLFGAVGYLSMRYVLRPLPG